MTGESVKMFRSALGGFNRDDVTNYIKETDQKHADVLAELTARLEEAERKCGELSAQAEEAQSENEALQLRLTEMTEQRDEARRAADQAEQVCGDLREALRCAEADYREVTEASAAKEAAWNAEKESMSAELAEIHAAAERDRQDFDRQLAEKNEYLTQFMQNCSGLTEERDSLTASLAEANVKITELTEKLQAAEEILAAQPEEPEYDPNDHSSPAYKLEMYDKISAQLGDILINANRNADDILSAAREEAEKLRIDMEIECDQKRAECESEAAQIRAETAEEAAYIRERLSANAASLLSTVSADLHVNIESCIREMNDCITDMQYEMQALLAKMSSRSGEMNDRISYYQSCVSEGIEKKISELDDKYGIPRSAEGERYDS
ncbi:MAG: hypothetical protein IJB20_02275 [Clostridia bacterium]|nr:hypothetical protein [Clostridia bacterium]